MTRDPYDLKCDECGKFIPLGALEDGSATRKLVTPDSHYSSEEFETICPACKGIAITWAKRL